MTNNVKVVRDNGLVSAKIIAHSISPEGKEIVTYELEYPRIILSELNTHTLFAKNSSSSRAIPVKKVIEMVKNNPAMPVRFGQHQSGMQDQGVEFDGKVQIPGMKYSLSGREAWIYAAVNACEVAQAMLDAGFAKQVANRLLEPFQRMKTVLTATEFENFFWLRDDKDADPTIESLAKAMREAKEKSTPELLEPGQWHTPYVDHFYENIGLEGDDALVFAGYCVKDEDGDTIVLDVEEAKAISSSCCAQVSYRVLNNTKDKALDIYNRLINGNKVHASPFQHQATPVDYYCEEVLELGGDISAWKKNDEGLSESWEEGITHVDRNGDFWSGNLKGWIQHRQLLKNHVKW